MIMNLINQVKGWFKSLFKNYKTGTQAGIFVKKVLEHGRVVAGVKKVRAYNLREQQTDLKKKIRYDIAYKDAQSSIDRFSSYLKGVRINRFKIIDKKYLDYYAYLMKMNLVEKSDKRLVYDRLSNFKNLLILETQRAGIDIGNPIAVYKFFNGKSIEEIYKAWSYKGCQADHFYDEIDADPEKFIKELVSDETVNEYTIRKKNSDEELDKFVEDFYG